MQKVIPFVVALLFLASPALADCTITHQGSGDTAGTPPNNAAFLAKSFSANSTDTFTFDCSNVGVVSIQPRGDSIFVAPFSESVSDSASYIEDNGQGRLELLDLSVDSVDVAIRANTAVDVHVWVREGGRNR